MHISNHLTDEELGSAILTPAVTFEKLFRRFFQKGKTFFEKKEELRILILGCNTGEHDLLPLIKVLDDEFGNSNKKIRIIAVDVKFSALKEAKKNYEEWKKTSNNLLNIKVEFIKQDIELEGTNNENGIFKKHKKGSSLYDLVIAFSVLHHFVNWKNSVGLIMSRLKKDGSFLITEYDDKYIGAWENNRKYERLNNGQVDTDVDSFFKYHDATDTDKMFYRNTLLETDITHLFSLLNRSCAIIKRKESYETKDQNKESFLKYALNQSTPIYWGGKMKTFLIKGKVQFNETEKSDKIGIIENENDWKKLCEHHKAEVNLYAFIKKSNIDTKKDNFQHEFSFANSLLSKGYSEATENKTSGRLYFQTLLFAQSLVKQIKLCLHLSWQTSILKNGEIGVDFSKQSNIFASSIIRREGFEDTFRLFFLHYLIQIKDQAKNLAISQPIFDFNNSNVVWLLELCEGDFKCEVKEILQSTDKGRFAVTFSIPKRYIINEDFNLLCEDSFNEFEQIFRKYKHYVYINFNKLFYDFIRKNKLLFDNFSLNRIFSDDAINNDKKKIKESISAAFNACSFDEFKNKEEIINMFAETVPYYALCASIGLTVIIPNHILKDTSSEADVKKDISNGTLVYCLENVRAEDFIKNISTPVDDSRYNRFVVLKRILDDYSRKFELPNIIDRQKELQKSVARESLQSTISKLFTRNFAHNIGSHVALQATNRYLKRRIEKLYKKSMGKLAIDTWLDLLTERFDHYEIHRNEYMAEQRQAVKTLYFYKDIILPFVENTLIMDTIASSENLTFCNDGKRAKLKVRVYRNEKEITAEYPQLRHAQCEGTAENIAYPNNFPYLLTCEEKERLEPGEGEKNYEKLQAAYRNVKVSEGDFKVSIYSEHAIYSILENVIRNSSKHNKGIETLDIIIRIEDILDEKVEKRTTEFGDANLDDTHYRIMIHDSVSNIKYEVLEKLHNSINRELIDGTGQSNKEALGIQDMKVNAFLCQTDDEISEKGLKNALTLCHCTCTFNNDKSENILPCLKDAFSEKTNKEKTFNFGYRFYLSKPRNVLWIGKDSDSQSEGSVFYKDAKTFLSRNKEAINPISKYQFAILEREAVENLNEQDWNTLLYLLPFRVLLNDVENCESEGFINKLVAQRRITKVNQSIVIESDDFKLLKNCWQQWLKNRWNKPNTKVYLYFEDKNEQWKVDAINEQLGEGYELVLLHQDSQNVKINLEDYNIIYDHHGHTFSKLGIEKIVNEEGNESSPLEMVTKNQYQYFDKASLDFTKLLYPPDDVKHQTVLLYEMIEAGYFKIVIIDERVAESIDDDNNHYDAITNQTSLVRRNTSKKVTFGDICNANGTFLVTKIGKSQIIPTEIDNLVWETDKFVYHDNSEIQYDAVVIHRTYMKDKWLYENKKSDIFLEQIQQIVPHVYLESGGGKPHSIPHDFKFIPYSSLNKCFSSSVSKLNLIQLL